MVRAKAAQLPTYLAEKARGGEIIIGMIAEGRHTQRSAA